MKDLELEQIDSLETKIKSRMTNKDIIDIRLSQKAFQMSLIALRRSFSFLTRLVQLVLGSPICLKSNRRGHLCLVNETDKKRTIDSIATVTTYAGATIDQGGKDD